MKRIVLVVLVIALVENCYGYSYGYVPLRCRPRYSPYTGGLVPSGFHYSPYAFNYQYPSGLVPLDVYYSPYAFSHQHPSGLVVGYSGYPYPYHYYPYYFPPHDCPPPLIVQPQKPSDYSEVKEKKQSREPRENDGKLIVYNYLRNKGFDVDIVNGFSWRNQTVSTIFLIRSQNWLIKYQNPELEKSLGGNPLWEKYKKRWEEKEKEYKAKGWKVGILNK